MPGILFFAILCLFAHVLPALASDALVVQSLNVKPYEQLYEGFRAFFGGSVARVVLSESHRDLAQVLREERPRVVVAIGTDALRQASRVAHVPVVHAMVLNPEAVAAGGAATAGTDMVIPPERQITLLRKIVPAVRRVGIVYDGTASESFVRRAAVAARGAGIELVLRDVRTVKEMPKALASLKGVVDALWVLPDQTVASAETMQLLLLHGVENRIPVLAFSAKYVKMGALLSLDLDPRDLGRQTAELARRMAAGEKVAETAPPRSAVPHVNVKVARKIGVPVDEELLRKLGARRID